MELRKIPIVFFAACTFSAACLPWTVAAQGESPLLAKPVNLGIQSGAALVIDRETGEPLYRKNADQVMPIASITKLMTAMVILDSGLPLLDLVAVDRKDIDRLKGSHSKLPVGTELMRAELLKLSLMASENRAAAALARTYPGGTPAFVEAMNAKALELGMYDTRFVDATGLHPGNVATAEDLVKLVSAAHSYPLIRDYSTASSFAVESVVSRHRQLLQYVNSNRMVRSPQWEIELSKTGYISEAGRCLVLHVRIADKPLVIVLLDSWGRFTRIGDANRIRRWIETYLIPGGRFSS